LKNLLLGIELFYVLTSLTTTISMLYGMDSSQMLFEGEKTTIWKWICNTIFLLKFYRCAKIIAEQESRLYPCKMDVIPLSREIILTHLSIFPPWLLRRQKSCNSLLQGRCMLFIGIRTRKKQNTKCHWRSCVLNHC